jgi:hypothetical protein
MGSYELKMLVEHLRKMEFLTLLRDKLFKTLFNIVKVVKSGK